MLSLPARHQPAHRLSTLEKRRSRHGRDEFGTRPTFLARRSSRRVHWQSRAQQAEAPNAPRACVLAHSLAHQHGRLFQLRHPYDVAHIRRRRVAMPQPQLEPALQLRKAPAARRIRIHPLVISRPHFPTQVSLANSEGERTDEDEMSRCAHELGQIASLAPPSTPSGSGAQSQFFRFLHPVAPARARATG